MEFPQCCMERNIPIQLMPECLSASSASAIVAALQGPPQSIRVDLWALEINPDPMEGSDLLYNRRGVL